MPECLAVADGADQAQRWQLAVENLGPAWFCRPCGSAEEALRLLAEQPMQLAVCIGQAGETVQARLRE
ncbi:MAG: hypothetical protein ACI4OY_06730, partial [Aristaeellaceae bacterium]